MVGALDSPAAERPGSRRLRTRRRTKDRIPLLSLLVLGAASLTALAVRNVLVRAELRWTEALSAKPSRGYASAELHWYEAHGVGRVEMKVKRLLD
jgi:hypothetical protein